MLSPAVALALALVLGLAGCATGLQEGDRLFLAGDLIRAEAAYRGYLGGYLSGGGPVGAGAARARYRLGLIYAFPESALYDLEKADRTLRSLVATDPGSAWGRQAALLLSLHAESARLERELTAQADKVSRLLAEVVKLREAAEAAGDVAQDREARVAQLGREIEELRRNIGQLGERLAAREKELERIKKIDLQTPP